MSPQKPDDVIIPDLFIYDKEFYDEMSSLSEKYYKKIKNNGSCANENAAQYFYNDFKADYAIVNYCRNCPVRVECLHYSLINNEESCTWGGFDEHYRRAVQSAVRIRLQKLCPDIELSYLFTYNKFLWNILITEFEEVTKNPDKIYIKNGQLSLKKNKEKNLLAFP